MHWKETDHTAPAGAQGRYPITTAVPEAIRHIGAIALAEPIKAPLLEPLPTEVPVALLQGLQVETTEVAPVAPQPDHLVALIEAPAALTVPVEVYEALAVLLQDHRHPVAGAAEGVTKKHGPLFQ